jgi:aspartyl-tRNA(Asn)/glutamyl-tRNA(Gln) amidotransferase subunit A
LAGEAPRRLDLAPLKGLRAGIPQGLPLADLDATVAARFADALARLGQAGMTLSDEVFPQFDAMQALQSPVPIASVEAYAIHRDRIATRAQDFDPIVLARMQAGRDVTPERHRQMLVERAALVRSMDARLTGLDILVLPTTPIVAPTKAEVANADAFVARNRLLLRNTGLGNSFDLCAISLPLPREGGLPVGLMLMARAGQDQRLFAIAAAVEKLLAV